MDLNFFLKKFFFILKSFFFFLTKIRNLFQINKSIYFANENIIIFFESHYIHNYRNK